MWVVLEEAVWPMKSTQHGTLVWVLFLRTCSVKHFSRRQTIRKKHNWYRIFCPARTLGHVCGTSGPLRKHRKLRQAGMTQSSHNHQD